MQAVYQSGGRGKWGKGCKTEVKKVIRKAKRKGKERGK